MVDVKQRGKRRLIHAIKSRPVAIVPDAMDLADVLEVIDLDPIPDDTADLEVSDRATPTAEQAILASITRRS